MFFSSYLRCFSQDLTEFICHTISYRTKANKECLQGYVTLDTQPYRSISDKKLSTLASHPLPPLSDFISLVVCKHGRQGWQTVSLCEGHSMQAHVAYVHNLPLKYGLPVAFVAGRHLRLVLNRRCNDNLLSQIFTFSFQTGLVDFITLHGLF